MLNVPTLIWQVCEGLWDPDKKVEYIWRERVNDRGETIETHKKCANTNTKLKKQYRILLNEH